MMAAPDDITGPMNLGNPVETSVAELAQLIIELTGSRSKIVHRPLPVDDPIQRCPDISQAKALLDWEPRTALRPGLAAHDRLFRQAAGRARRDPQAKGRARWRRPAGRAHGPNSGTWFRQRPRSCTRRPVDAPRTFSSIGLIRRRADLTGQQAVDRRVVDIEFGEFGRDVAGRRERAGAEIILDRDVGRAARHNRR